MTAGRRSDSPDGLRRERVLRVPVSPAESEILDAWAEHLEQPLAELVRAAAIRAATRAAKERAR